MMKDFAPFPTQPQLPIFKCARVSNWCIAAKVQGGEILKERQNYANKDLKKKKEKKKEKKKILSPSADLLVVLAHLLRFPLPLPLRNCSSHSLRKRHEVVLGCMMTS